MMFLPALAVVFAGILNGGHSGGVDRQIKPILHDLKVRSIALPASALRTLTHHGDGTKEIVQSLHADGVIGFEVVTGHGSPTLRLVIYDGSGSLKTYTEISLMGRGLAADDLDVLRQNISDDVASLGGGSAEQIAANEPAPAPAVLHQEIEMDDAPPGLDPAAPAPHEAKPLGTAAASDAVSADEIAAMTGGNDAADSGSTGGALDELHAQGSSIAALHLGASVGFGVAGRTFTPSAATVPAYGTSTPVGSTSLEAHVSPIERIQLAVAYDRSLDMTTPMSDHSIAATTFSRWEAYGTYTLLHQGDFELGARAGAGHRAFSIDSSVAGRSPDSDYVYAIAGITGAEKLGSRLTLRALAAFEPVWGGDQATEMSMGATSRWALDVGAALEYRPYAHLFARVAAEYQRFTWSWDMAASGRGGTGGATDEYPSGTIALGADY